MKRHDLFNNLTDAIVALLKDGEDPDNIQAAVHGAIIGYRGRLP